MTKIEYRYLSGEERIANMKRLDVLKKQRMELETKKDEISDKITELHKEMLVCKRLIVTGRERIKKPLKVRKK